MMFSLGDVSGKGVPAALFMFAAQHMLRSQATQGTSLEHVLGELNDNLSANNASATLVTMFVGRHNLRTYELEYALAGHQPPFLKRADGSIEELKAPATASWSSPTASPRPATRTTTSSAWSVS